MDPVYGFFNAVKNGDERGVSRYVGMLTPRLTRYLENQFGASKPVALDIVNQSLAYVCEGILQGQIQLEDGLLKYILVTCKHAYFRYLDDARRGTRYSGMVHDPAVSYDHLDVLMQKERRVILERCILKFSPENQAFIRFLMDRPGCDPAEISAAFGLSLGNVYTKKSRIVKLLSDCVQREENR